MTHPHKRRQPGRKPRRKPRGLKKFGNQISKILATIKSRDPKKPRRRARSKQLGRIRNRGTVDLRKPKVRGAKPGRGTVDLRKPKTRGRSPSSILKRRRVFRRRRR